VEILDLAPADLSDDLASRIHTLLNHTWPEDAPREGDYYRTHGTPTALVILRRAQDVLAHLAIYERQVGIGNETFDIGMLGGIVVAPEQRRRGHCRALVRHAHERLKGRRLPFSILFASEPGVYASSGYKLMQNATRFVDADGALKTLVYRGGMFAELSQRPWPNQTLDLRGRVV
jgi:predicted acetyltransferase